MRRYQLTVAPASYERRVDAVQHLKDLVSLPLDRITPQVVEDLIMRIAAKNPRTAVIVLQTIKKILRAAKTRGQRVNEAVLDIKPPRHAPRAKTFLTKAQVDLLSDSSTEPGLLRFAALTGLRQHEIFQLTDDDVNVEAKSITVQKSKTPAGRRTIPLVREARLILAEQRLVRPHGSNLVFSAPSGGTWNKDNFNHRVFRPAVDASGIGPKRLTFHDLRHTFAALMVAAGVHPKTLQALMGHKDIRVTMDTYGHLYEGAEVAAIEQLERFLDGPSAPSVPHEEENRDESDPANPASLSDGAYRDRTGDLRLAKLDDFGLTVRH